MLTVPPCTLTLEAGALEILHRRIGVDGDLGSAGHELQESAP
jgi:hypothetical protein